jgi:transcriptional regulator with XRE-family HTH domain
VDDKFGPAFIKARERAGLTAGEAARRSGITSGAISYYESGQRVPGASAVWVLADVYGCTIDELLGRHKSPAPLQMTVHSSQPLSDYQRSLIHAFVTLIAGNQKAS